MKIDCFDEMVAQTNEIFVRVRFLLSRVALTTLPGAPLKRFLLMSTLMKP
jgi:hypothetical protein